MEKKITKSNESYYVNLPKQVCMMFGWDNNTLIDIKIGNNNTLIVSEVKK